jgi:hypothetical protein
MNTYAVTWTIGETKLIKATSKSEALDIVANLTDADLLADIRNIMASFEVTDIEKI